VAEVKAVVAVSRRSITRIACGCAALWLRLELVVGVGRHCPGRSASCDGWA
jgi:hypothetical protein